MEPISQFWIVLGRTASGRFTGQSNVGHTTPAAAEAEALRLAAKDPGTTFFVLATVYAALAQKPTAQPVPIRGFIPEPEDIIDYMEARAAASVRGPTAEQAALREGPGKSPLAGSAPSLVNAGLPPLTLREGAFYMRRDCGVVGPLRRNDTSGEWGSTLMDGHPNDLIAECDAVGWVTWTGGECPVPDSCVVEYQLGSGLTSHSVANRLRWKKANPVDDIVRFRVVRS